MVAVYHHSFRRSHESIYPVCADITSPELLAAPLRGVDTVVHLAWEGGLAGPEPLNGSLTDRAGQDAQPQPWHAAHVLTAMERAGTRRIVFLSALGADRRATAPFLREKYLAETLIAEFDGFRRKSSCARRSPGAVDTASTTGFSKR